MSRMPCDAGRAAGSLQGSRKLQPSHNAAARCALLVHLQPLPTGRLLTAEDVSPALTGRQAELFWPDDGKWYLIQFNAIYMDSRKAE